MTWNPSNEAIDELFERGYADGESIGKDIAQKLVRAGEVLPSESLGIIRYLINGIRLGMSNGFLEGMSPKPTAVEPKVEEPLPAPAKVVEKIMERSVPIAKALVIEKAAPEPPPTPTNPEPAQPPMPDLRPSKLWKKGLDYNKTKICACGCGAIIPFYNEHGKERVYFAGHMLKRYSDERKRADAEASRKK